MDKNADVVVRSAELQKTKKQKIMDALSGRFRLAPVIGALLIIWIVFQCINSNFISSRNISNLLLQIVSIGFSSCALFPLLVIGEFDLSLANTGAAACGLLALMTVENNGNIFVALVLCILACLAWGAINGFIINYLHAPAFIVTLGGMMVMTGMLYFMLPERTLSIGLTGTWLGWPTSTYLSTGVSFIFLAIAIVVLGILRIQDYTQMKKYGQKAKAFNVVVLPLLLVAVIGSVAILILGLYKGVNVSVLALLVLLAILYYVMTQTKFGVYIYAIGNSREAARRAGINVEMVCIVARMFATLIMGLAGVMSCSRLLAVNTQSMSTTLTLNAIAASTLGGASMAGGRGNVWGILIGALVIGSLTNGLYLCQAPTAIMYTVQGVILVLAIILDSMITEASNTRK